MHGCLKISDRYAFTLTAKLFFFSFLYAFPRAPFRNDAAIWFLDRAGSSYSLGSMVRHASKGCYPNPEVLEHAYGNLQTRKPVVSLETCLFMTPPSLIQAPANSTI